VGQELGQGLPAVRKKSFARSEKLALRSNKLTTINRKGRLVILDRTTTKAIETLQAAFKRAMAIRPKIGGFPVLAEVLRQAGVQRNIWNLPSAESLYLTDLGPVINQGTPLVTGFADVPAFDQEALIRALRTDQAGKSTFPEFLMASWKAGVVRYDVDFAARQVIYYGCQGGSYIEAYPAVTL
jgi:uncharacterized protein YbcV (DUF1398 family)